MNKNLIRNFCIIAHIDHGKSTLADRFMQLTGAVDERKFCNQLLDNMELERERGITIKASAVRISYKAGNGKEYILNLIDTPGHVDFSYEVSKSLRASEGAVLVVDAAQGVEAQTVANLYQAQELGLEIIPVINKIDLDMADPERVKHQIGEILKLEKDRTILASAKKNIGISEILERIVSDVPAPDGEESSPLQALVFDSAYNSYRGVIIYIRLKNGIIRKGMRVKFMSSGSEYEVLELGIFNPKPQSLKELHCGEVGYVICNIRELREVKIGDTLTDAANPAVEALPGYREIKHMVYSGIYPISAKDFPLLRDAIEKLSLNDASFVYQLESSLSLGSGFRCGFLGLLHMEIVKERLEREYDLSLILTTPGVNYRIMTTKGDIIDIENPAQMPEPQKIEEIDEPYIKVFLIVPSSEMGDVLELAKTKRGTYQSTEYIDEEKIKLIYEFPLSEVIVDFYDRLKSITHGYGSLDYEFIGYRPTKLVKLDILVNGEKFDVLSSLVYKERAQEYGKALVAKLRKLIPRQLFEVVLQAAIGGKIIARERVAPIGKNVTAKCYGGDITRKRKLWEKKKEGKKRMKQFGKVQIPQEAFLAAVKA